MFTPEFWSQEALLSFFASAKCLGFFFIPAPQKCQLPAGHFLPNGQLLGGLQRFSLLY